MLGWVDFIYLFIYFPFLLECEEFTPVKETQTVSHPNFASTGDYFLLYDYVYIHRMFTKLKKRAMERGRIAPGCKSFCGIFCGSFCGILSINDILLALPSSPILVEKI